MLPEALIKWLVEFGIQRAALDGFDDAASLERLIRDGLESGKYGSAERCRTVFGSLLLILQFHGRFEEIAQALRAPWSPVRDEGDERFDRLYLSAISATRTAILPLERRRRYRRLSEHLSSTRGVRGEVAECGCHAGLSAHLMCQVLAEERPGFDGAGFHAFDSFQGLSEPTPKDAIPDDDPRAAGLRRMTVKGHFAVPLEVTRQSLAAFPRISFHPGWIPETFAGLPESVYRFVHVDVDLYQPTYDALAYFYDRLAPGGMIVSDDYLWPGARRALEEYAAAFDVKVEVGDAGQAAIRCPL